MSYTTETPIDESNSKSSSLDIRTFQRKTFDVEGVQVTEENFEAVAAWCGGSIVTVQNAENSMPLEIKDKRYIQVEVARPLSQRQTQAYVGDWVLYASKGFKVYGQRPFQKNFEPKKVARKLEEPVDPPQELRATSEPVEGTVTIGNEPQTILPENHQNQEPTAITHEAGPAGPAGGNWGGHD